MRTERLLLVRDLNPARVGEYRRSHDEVWPELVALYKRCGIVEVSCFLNGSRLAVLMETDPEAFPKQRGQLEAHPLEQRWRARMKEFDLPGTPGEVFEEVYRQSDL